MLHDQELQDDKNNSPKNRNQQQKTVATQDSKQQYNKMVGDGLSRQHHDPAAVENPQYMIMNNMESDTEEVYTQGKAYKKMGTSDLKRGFTQREGKKASNANAEMLMQLQGSNIDVEKF